MNEAICNTATVHPFSQVKSTSIVCACIFAKGMSIQPSKSTSLPAHVFLPTICFARVKVKPGTRNQPRIPLE